MATITNREELPDLAKPTADLIKKLGFDWAFDFEHPTPDPAKRVQIREENQYIPVRWSAGWPQMVRGDKFPPVESHRRL